MTNKIVYVWCRSVSMAVMSAEDDTFIVKFKKWAEAAGYIVTVKDSPIGLDDKSGTPRPS